MKRSLPIFCLSSLICAANCFGDDENLSLDSSDISEEVALLEPSFLTNLQGTQEEFDLSEAVILPKRKNAIWAATLSGILPGLGHLYLKDYRSAINLSGGYATLFGVGSWEKLDLTTRSSSLVTMSNLWEYSIYAAYRDARSYNLQSGYTYKMPSESFMSLATAPFSLSVLKKPEVWGGFLGALTAAGVMGYFLADKSELRISHSDEIFPLVAFPVGIGEEALFRGCLQPALSEYLSPWGGIIASSLLFGAAHLGNTEFMTSEEKRQYYSVSIPFITLFGTYFGWLAHKNGSLREGVALHCWYDFTLFLLSYSVAQSVSTRKPSFAFAFSF